MNITKEEVQQVLDALEYHLDQTRPIPSTQDAISLLQSKLAECPHGVDDGACKECYNVHTDHPMRHFDRTCPACQKDDVEPVAYGCHCDLESDQAPDGCVIDEKRFDDCAYARRISKKEECKYWLPIKFTHPAKQTPMTGDAEPVAWMRPSKEGYDSAFRDASTVAFCRSTERGGWSHWDEWIPLYTRPAKQTPMTRDQIIEVTAQLDQTPGYYIDIVRAIEKHHGIIK